MTSTPILDYDGLALAGNASLRQGDPGAARPVFEKLVSMRPSDQRAWHGLALACRDMGDDDAQIRAVDRLLAMNPSHLPALMMKGDHFARIGNGRAAHAFYDAVVARAAGRTDLTPEARGEVHRAARESDRYARTYEAHLRDALSGFGATGPGTRFGRCLDLLFGKSQIYLQSPTAFYYPELPQRQFYERDEFPWLRELEDKTDLIRDELMGVLAADAESFRPYVQSEDSRPKREYGALLDNPGWSAFYLIKAGEVITDAVMRCPRTMEALASAPLTDAPGRTPSVLFSLLRSGVRIPPHTGYTNARLICHLPLVVPDGCGLRVGAETRHWTEGRALIFDDSIEHEAWNRSSELRVVLLFDVWRPELSGEERAFIAAILAAVASYDGKASAWD